MLTWAERLTLWNQYEILKRINPEDTKEYETNQEILSHGYEQYYSEINPSIYENTTKREVSREVEEILNVFRAIKFSCLKLGYKPKSHWAEFEGFDANPTAEGVSAATTRTVVEGFISGLHRSPFTGFSTEFAEYRQYMPGDDLRYLDWKLLGRTDRYYIKKYRADTNSQCHILIDASASMKYTTGEVSKLQYAQFLGSAFAYLANKQQDAVGLIAFDHEVRTHVPALSRSGHMRTIFGRSELGLGGAVEYSRPTNKSPVAGSMQMPVSPHSPEPGKIEVGL